jgi:hypothetical protein
LALNSYCYSESYEESLKGKSPYPEKMTTLYCIEASNPGINDLGVKFKDGVVSLTGQAKGVEAMEKAVLMAGNVRACPRSFSTT